jgi:hypothetical protein
MRTKIAYIILGISFMAVLTETRVLANFFERRKENIEQPRTVSPFTAIEVGGGIDVVLSQGDKQSVSINADANIQEIVITEVDNNVLKIYFDKWKMSSSKVKVTVCMKDIKSLSSSGGSDIYTTSPIVAGNLNLNVSGGGDINIDVKAIEIKAELTGGSGLDLKGAAGYFYLSASGGSKCKSYEFTVAKADISASGGSTIRLTVDKDLKASASGGSSVKYKGNAHIIKEDESGGSQISKE